MALIARARWYGRIKGGFRWFSAGEEIVGQVESPESLVSRGVAVLSEGTEVSEAGGDVEQEEPTAPPVDEEAEESEEEPVVEVKKPRKTDKVDVWRAYAASIKHPHKGKTREQLISELA